MLKKILLNSLILMVAANLSASDKKEKESNNFAAACWAAGAAGFGYLSFVSYKFLRPTKSGDKIWTKIADYSEHNGVASNKFEQNIYIVNRVFPLTFWSFCTLYCAHKAFSALEGS